MSSNSVSDPSSASTRSSVIARRAARNARIQELARITNLDEFAIAVLLELGIDPLEGDEPEYHVMSPARGADMLSWAAKVRATKAVPAHDKLRVQIQDLGDGYARIGAIGDGNCMVHSFFTALSPAYRRQDMEIRQKIADKFREVLVERVEELREIANEIYSTIGGADTLFDSFNNLVGHEESNSSGSGSTSSSTTNSGGSRIIRSEIDIELGPVIANLYELNFLAVRIDDSLNMLPVKQTLYGRDPLLPTVFIHYMGGATNMGAANAFGGQGHYEVIVRPELEGRDRFPRSGTVELNLADTIFQFEHEELEDVLTMFGSLNAPNVDPEVGAYVVMAARRKEAEGIELSPATLQTIAAINRNPELKAAVEKEIVKKQTEAAGGKKKSSSPKKPALFAASSSASAARSSSSGAVSPRTMALIAALEKAEMTAAKKVASPKGHRTTRKATSAAKPAAGGAGAPSTGLRRSARLTQKKKSSSSSHNSSNSLSPNTVAALFKSMSLKKKGSSNSNA
jgi:hypothetical protein